jgi:hypothetical protein
MAKPCKAQGCELNRFGGGYCKYHQRMREDKKPGRIAMYSKKRKVINRDYDKEAKEFRENHPDCEIRSPVCTGHTQGVHHKKGRGQYLLAKEFWAGACNPCNVYIEDHPVWAREHGHKLSKFL